MDQTNNDRLISSPPPPYSSLYPEQTLATSSTSSKSQTNNLGQLHSEGGSRDYRRHSRQSNEFRSQSFFVDETSRKKVIKNQEKINLEKKSALLDAIDVYPLNQFPAHEVVARKGVTMLSREEHGTTFVGSQGFTSEKCLEYLLLPSISHKDVFSALRNWTLENRSNEWNWNNLQIEGILTSFVWEYKLGTICEWRTITGSEKANHGNVNTCFSKWAVEIQRPEDLKPKTVNISNSTPSLNCNCLDIGQNTDLCPKCQRKMKENPQFQITAKWKKLYDNHFTKVNGPKTKTSKRKLPDDFLRRCHGKRGYEYTCEYGKVNPITNNECLETKMIEVSRKLLELHKSKAEEGKIVKQRHEVVSIPVYEVLCRQGRQRFRLCIAGTNHIVFLPML